MVDSSTKNIFQSIKMSKIEAMIKLIFWLALEVVNNVPNVWLD